MPAILEDVVSKLESGGFNNILFLVGAGISTSAGIPDFRTPGTGLYSNLTKYKLPYPEAIFQLSYFKKSPEPFFQLAREINPQKYNQPTLFHYFIAEIHKRYGVRRVYTQNIDTLERIAGGIPEDKIVEAHGSFANNKCIKCSADMSSERFNELLFKDKVVRCDKCKTGLVKPSIVFFGEQLPEKFFECWDEDVSKADLIVVAGTSLAVHPVAAIPEEVKEDQCTRVLINKEKVGSFGERENDLLLLGGADEMALKIARLCGFEDELLELQKKQKARSDDNDDDESEVSESEHSPEESDHRAPTTATKDEASVETEKEAEELADAIKDKLNI